MTSAAFGVPHNHIFPYFFRLTDKEKRAKETGIPGLPDTQNFDLCAIQLLHSCSSPTGSCFAHPVSDPIRENHEIRLSAIALATENQLPHVQIRIVGFFVSRLNPFPAKKQIP
jgi:hypothetical protein